MEKMEKLPVPRDSEERRKMLATWERATLTYTGFTGTQAIVEAERFIPPVGEEKMPELREPWYVITKKTGIVWHGPFTTSEAAERMRLTRNDFSRYAPSDLLTVRLAVVEVVDAPENVAPSGRRYRLWKNGDGVRIDDETCRTIHDCGSAVACIPLEDVPFVAALLAGKGEGA